MSLMITDECINCDVSRARVSQQCDFAGRRESIIIDPATSAPNASATMTEPQCVQVCPVDCIPKTRNNVETVELLWVKYEKLTGNKRP